VLSEAGTPTVIQSLNVMQALHATPCTQSPARIMIVDDDQVSREKLAHDLAECPDMIVSCQTDFDRIESRITEVLSADVAIINISNQNSRAITVIHLIKHRFPAARLLAISADGEEILRELVMSIGVIGHVDKLATLQWVVAVIRHMLNGHVLLSDRSFHQLIALGSTNSERSSFSNIDALTEREFEVFRLIGAGFTTAEIASQLLLSVKTVETHRHKIKMRLNLRNSCVLTFEAVRWVVRHPSQKHVNELVSTPNDRRSQRPLV